MKAPFSVAWTLKNMFYIMQTNNANYIHGWGCICSRKHPSFNYGQTGMYWTDACSPEGYAWFAASFDDDFARPAVLAKVKHIHTDESTYSNGLEIA